MEPTKATSSHTGETKAVSPQRLAYDESPSIEALLKVVKDIILCRPFPSSPNFRFNETSKNLISFRGALDLLSMSLTCKKVNLFLSTIAGERLSLSNVKKCIRKSTDETKEEAKQLRQRLEVAWKALIAKVLAMLDIWIANPSQPSVANLKIIKVLVQANLKK